MKIKTTNIKKPSPKTLLFIIPAIVLMLSLLIAFNQTVANHRNYPTEDSWKFYDVSNTKRFFKEFFFTASVNLQKLLIDNQTIKKTLQDNHIDYLEISTSATNLLKLNSDLPKTGQKYVKATLIAADQKDNQNIRLKYRGDNYYHWGFTKKSIKIKYDDDQIINLVNPKEIDFLADKIAFDLAKYLKIPTPKTKLTGLFINNDFKGIYLETQEVDSLFASQQNPPFEAIFQGENVGSSKKSGPGLFHNEDKWQVNGGHSSKDNLKTFISALNNDDFDQLKQLLDFNHWANFYSFISIVHGSHLDNTHNWFLGSYNQKFYPIVWDPVGWVMSYKYGNGIEELKSEVSQTLRRNVFFNQKFINTLWSTINQQNTPEWLDQTIDQQQITLANILDYDFFKGGVFKNPKGVRAPQSSQNIQQEIDLLQQRIKQRFEFINDSISTASAKYYIDQDTQYLHIQYTGIASATITTPQNQPIEVLNLGSFLPLPSSLKQTLVSGRTTSQGVHPYAIICPMTYRIKTNQSSENSHLNLLNQLTGKSIKVEKVDHFKPSDCEMDFTNPDTSTDTPNQNPISINNNENQFEIKFSTINPNIYFSHQEKAKDNITLSTPTFSYQNVDFDKKIFSQKINLTFKNTPYFGQKRIDLYPLDRQYSNLPLSIDIAKLVSLPFPKTELVNLSANNFYIDQFLLVEDLKNKSFFETNQLTYDTDIYKFKKGNSSKIENWEKISSDPRIKNKNIDTLKDLFNSIEKPDQLVNLIDWQNLAHFYTYLELTGDQFPEYFLYFDNTQAKFKFIPQKQSLYKTDPNSSNFNNLDPLLTAITKHPKTRNLLLSKIKQVTINPSLLENQPNYPESFWSIYQLNLQHFQTLQDQITVDPIKTEIDRDLFVQSQKIFNPGEDHNSIIIRAGDYNITKNIIIPAGLKVTIHPGTTLNINPKVSIISYSQVIALGTKQKPIKIIPRKDKAWGVFALIGENTNQSVFEFVTIDGGSEAFINRTYLSGQFSAYHSNITIKDSTFINSQSDDGLNLKYSDSLIQNSHFANNSADAIDLDYVTGIVENNTFDNNGNDSIDISGSTVSIKNNHIKNSGDKCISIGEQSQPQIENNFLDGCNIGIEIKDQSTADIHQNTIQNNNIGINAYQKKDFFSGGTINSYTTTFFNNTADTDYQNTFTGTKLNTDNSKITIY